MPRKDKSVIKKATNIILLLIPVSFAALGVFLSPLLLNKILVGSKHLELYRFLIALILFLVSSAIIFIKTRSENPKIKLDAPKQDG